MRCRCRWIRERWSRCRRTSSKRFEALSLMRARVRVVCALSARCESAYIARRGALAQLGERLVCNQEVAGSIPVRSITPTTRSSPPRRIRRRRDDSVPCHATGCQSGRRYDRDGGVGAAPFPCGSSEPTALTVACCGDVLYGTRRVRGSVSRRDGDEDDGGMNYSQPIDEGRNFKRVRIGVGIACQQREDAEDYVSHLSPPRRSRF